MDEKQLQALYNAMQGKLGLGSFDQFKSTIYSDSNFRKAFYNEASSELELGDYDSFDNSLKKKVSQNWVSKIFSPSTSSSTPQSASINGKEKTTKSWMDAAKQQPATETEIAEFDKAAAESNKAYDFFNERLVGKMVYRPTNEQKDWKWDVISTKDSPNASAKTMQDFQHGDIIKHPDSKTGYKQVVFDNGQWSWNDIVKPVKISKTEEEVTIKVFKPKIALADAEKKLKSDIEENKDIGTAMYLGESKSDLLNQKLASNPELYKTLKDEIKSNPDQARTADGRFELFNKALVKNYRLEENPFDKNKRPNLDEAEFNEFSKMAKDAEPLFSQLTETVVKDQSGKYYNGLYDMATQLKAKAELSKDPKVINEYNEAVSQIDGLKEQLSPVMDYFKRSDVSEALHLLELQRQGQTELSGALQYFPKYKDRVLEAERRYYSDDDNISFLRSLAGGILDTFAGLVSTVAKVNPMSGLNPLADRQIDKLYDNYKLWSKAKFTTPKDTGSDLINFINQALRAAPAMIGTIATRNPRLAGAAFIAAPSYAESYNESLSQGLSKEAAHTKGIVDAGIQWVSEAIVPEKKLVAGFKPSRELTELAIRDFGSEAFKKGLSAELRQYIKSQPGKFAKDIVGQWGEEQVANKASMITNAVTNAISGTEFDTEVSLENEKNLLGSIAVLTVGIKSLGGTFKGTNPKAKSYRDYILKNAAKDYGWASSVIEALKADPEINQEYIAEIEEDLGKMAGLKFPEGSTPEQQVVLADAVKNIRQLQQIKETTEPEFQKNIDGQIKEWQDKINTVQDNPKEAEGEVDTASADKEIKKTEKEIFAEPQPQDKATASTPKGNTSNVGVEAGSVGVVDAEVKKFTEEEDNIIKDISIDANTNIGKYVENKPTGKKDKFANNIYEYEATNPFSNEKVTFKKKTDAVDYVIKEVSKATTKSGREEIFNKQQSLKETPKAETPTQKGAPEKVQEEGVGVGGDGFKQAGEKARDTKDATHIGRWMLDNSQKGDVVRFQDGGYEVTEVNTKKDGTKELVLTPFEFNEDGSKDYNNTGIKIITEQSIKNGSNLFENAYTNSKGERVIEQSTYEPVEQSLKETTKAETPTPKGNTSNVGGDKPKIKLTLSGKFANVEGADNAVKEINELGERNPFNDSQVVINGVKVNAERDGGKIWLKDITAIEQGKGTGTKVLKQIQDIADKHDIDIVLHPTKIKNTTEEQLKKWYKDNGFEDYTRGRLIYKAKSRETTTPKGNTSNVFEALDSIADKFTDKTNEKVKETVPILKRLLPEKIGDYKFKGVESRGGGTWVITYTTEKDNYAGGKYLVDQNFVLFGEDVIGKSDSEISKTIQERANKNSITGVVKPQDKATASTPEEISQPIAGSGGVGGDVHKQNIHDKFRKEFESKGIPKEQVDGAIALMEARAKSWASEEKGRNADDWYSRIADVKSGEFQNKERLQFQHKYQYNNDTKDINSNASQEFLDKVRNENRGSLGRYMGLIKNKGLEFAKNEYVKIDPKVIEQQKADAKAEKVKNRRKAYYEKNKEKIKEQAANRKEELDRIESEEDDFFVDSMRRNFSNKDLINEFVSFLPSDFPENMRKVAEKFGQGDDGGFYILIGKYLSDFAKKRGDSNSEKVEKLIMSEEYEDYFHRLMYGKFDSDVEFQKENGIAKGAVETLADGRKVIHALDAPDFSTMVHEIAHVFEGDLTAAESNIVKDFGGSEAFARGFEKYLRDGKAPTTELKTLFDKFKEWLTNIYKTLKGSPIEKRVTPEIKQIFDRLLTEQSLKETTKGEQEPPQEPPLEGKGEVEGDDGGLSGIKKALVSDEIIKGVDLEKIGDKEMMSLGRKIIDTGEVKPEALVQKIITEKAGVLAPKEVVALITYKADVDNALRDAYKQANERQAAGEDMGTLGVEIKDLERQQNDFDVMAVITANQQSMAFRLRRVMLDRDYNLVTQIEKYKKHNNGYIPPEIEAKFRDLDKQLKEVKEQLAEAEKKAADKEGQEAVDNIKESVDRERKYTDEELEKKVQEGVDTEINKIFEQLPAEKKRAGDKAIAALEKFRKKLRGRVYESTLGIPVAIADLGAATAIRAIKVGRTVAEAVEMGINRIKKALKEKGIDKWDKEADYRRDLAETLEGEGVSLKQVKDKPVINEDGTVSIPNQMLRNLVESGVTDINDLTTAVHKEVAKDLPDITERQVRDYITEYGKQVNPTADNIQQQINTAKRVGRLLSELEDVQNKIKKVSNPENRVKLTTKERELKRQISSLKKDTFGSEEKSDEQQLFDAKERTKSRIAELEIKLKNKDFAKPVKKVKPIDTELADLTAKKEKLQEEFDNEQYKLELKNRNGWQKAEDVALEVTSGLVRGLVASLDVSATFVQGMYRLMIDLGKSTWQIARLKKPSPNRSLIAIKDMFRSLVSQKYADNYLAGIKASEKYPLMKASKLAIDDKAGHVSAKEGFFISNWINLIWNHALAPTFAMPISIFTKGNVRKAYDIAKAINPYLASQRAFDGYVNSVRVNSFKDFAISLENSGYTFESDPKVFQKAGDVINTTTGRGSLGAADASSRWLNIFLFAPRKVVSEVKLFTPYAFAYYAKMPKPVRTKALKDLAIFLASFTTANALMWASNKPDEDDEEEMKIWKDFWNMNSSNFLTHKIGEKRVSIGGGARSMIVFQSRLLTGDFTDQYGKTTELGDRFGKQINTRFDLITNFIAGKSSPAIAVAVKKAQERKGLEVDEMELIRDVTVPIWMQDLKEMYKTDPTSVNAILTAFSLFGANVRAVDPSKKSQGKTITIKNPISNTERELTKEEYQTYQDRRKVIQDDLLSDLKQSGVGLDSYGNITLDIDVIVDKISFDDLNEDEQKDILSRASISAANRSKYEIQRKEIGVPESAVNEEYKAKRIKLRAKLSAFKPKKILKTE